MKIHNFSAGPSILPDSVFQKASKAVVNFKNSNLSILEISHRSPLFNEVILHAKELVLELSGLKGKGYEVLFLQGGASLQFLMLAYNLLKKEGKAGYIDTGTWSKKSIKEAMILGDVQVLASSADKGYNYIPKNVKIPQGLDYVHLTTNNTIFGTQIKEFPDVNIPLIADMSSDLFSRQLDFSKFDLIYAGAQKNIGASGTTLVIIKKEILGKTQREIPSMLDYQIHIDKGSLFNTPSVYSIYVSMLNLQWLTDLGGIPAIEKINAQKAKILYNEIDSNPNYKGYVAKEDRSFMNITFNLTDESKKERFDLLAQKAGIHAIKGHRSVGGYRASTYNAMPLESVQALVDVMRAL